MPPAEPKTILIRDRIIEVLEAIRAGDDFNYTPSGVYGRWIHPHETKGYPYYCVFIDESDDPEAHVGNVGGGYILDQNIIWSIQGMAKVGKQEVEKCMADIKKAIWADAVLQSAGTLRSLTVRTIPGKFITDSGYSDVEGYRFFDQKINTLVSGDAGDI